jgi:cell division septation protein DedD
MFQLHQSQPWFEYARSKGLLGVALISACVLSGCAYWPKALTFGSSAAPAEQTATATPPVTPAPEEPKPELAVATVEEAPKAVVLPPARIAPEPLPPMASPSTASPAATPPLTPVAPQSMAVKGKGYLINVGLFAVPSNGSNAHEKLKAAGMPVVSDFIESKKKGTLTRVRVGPFDNRAQADAAARQIRALKLDAVVVQP